MLCYPCLFAVFKYIRDVTCNSDHFHSFNRPRMWQHIAGLSGINLNHSKIMLVFLAVLHDLLVNQISLLIIPGIDQILLQNSEAFRESGALFRMLLRYFFFQHINNLDVSHITQLVLFFHSIKVFLFKFKCVI